MTDTTLETADETSELSSYTTETQPSASTGPGRSGNRGPGQASGGRKKAVARVYLKPGTGKWTINGRSLETYFTNKVHQQAVREPFLILDLVDAYDVVARIDGGGISGQAGALRLGIARALQLIEPDDRPPLKKAGFLRRDPRAKERKKYGLKKARKAPQFSKR